MPVGVVPGSMYEYVSSTMHAKKLARVTDSDCYLIAPVARFRLSQPPRPTRPLRPGAEAVGGADGPGGAVRVRACPGTNIPWYIILMLDFSCCCCCYCCCYILLLCAVSAFSLHASSNSLSLQPGHHQETLDLNYLPYQARPPVLWYQHKVA